MSSTLREIFHIFSDSFSRPRVLGLFVCGVLLFSLIGPFGTYMLLPFPMRLAYWATTMLGAWFISMFFIGVVLAVVRPYWDKPLPLMLLGALLGAFPAAVFIGLVIEWFLPRTVMFSEVVGFAIPICLSFSALSYFLIESHIVASNEPDDNALMQRLSPGIRGPVKYMSMQDHYVNVTTARGSEMVLMRMADAASAMGENQGAQVHRSHWVGREYIAKSRREKGQLIITMDDGTDIPVSRSYVKAANVLLKG